MKPQSIFISLLGAFLCFGTSVFGQSSIDYTREVNPFIGTDFKGNTYPGAQAPFGMVQLSPDNGTGGWDRIAGYFYPDSTIAGFSHTHLSGTGAGDLYDVSFLPVTLPCRVAPGALGVHSVFSHSEEEARAGYYRVRLSDYDIQVELTASPRVGWQRYTFPEAHAAVILNLKKAMNWDATLDTYLEQVDARTVQGYRFSDGWARQQKVFFVTRFSRPFDSLSVESTPLVPGKKEEGKVARFYFDTSKGEQITVATALSSVSCDGAMANLKAEAPEDDFDHALAQATASWNQALGKIEVEGGSQEERQIFYTALYHSELAPTLFSDVDGRYRGGDGHIHRTIRGEHYSTFSLWDTYRAAHPLYTLVEAHRVNDMIESLLDFQSQHGRLPVWTLWGSETDMMIGYHSVPVLVDAYLKGLVSQRAEEALAACVTTANWDRYRGVGIYKEKGYVPCDNEGAYQQPEQWSLSRTMEYAFDDGCIARFARWMNRDSLAGVFERRAQNYRHLFNPATGFFQPRTYEGCFLPDFVPEDYSQPICESNAWHYLWSVQQDVHGLIQLLGGRKAALRRLDALFSSVPQDTAQLPLFSTGMIGQYVHGNEPCHHVPYLYNVLRQPWKTQQRVNQIRRSFYTSHPDGLCGNDDCGQMSAWYVLSALGFYPLDPVGGNFEIGTPLFSKVKVHLDNGRTFTLSAPGVSEENKYVKSVRVNGKRYRRSALPYSLLSEGAEVEFEMTSQPGHCWY